MPYEMLLELSYHVAPPIRHKDEFNDNAFMSYLSNTNQMRAGQACLKC